MIKTKHFVSAVAALSIAIGALWVVVVDGLNECHKDRAALRNLFEQKFNK